MAFKYEVNGHLVEFDQEPNEQDIDEAASQLGSSKIQEQAIQKEPSLFNKMTSAAVEPFTSGDVGSIISGQAPMKMAGNVQNVLTENLVDRPGFDIYKKAPSKLQPFARELEKLGVGVLADVAGGFGTNAIARPLSKAFARSAEKQTGKAQRLTEQLLKPKGDFPSRILKGETAKGIPEAAQVIKKSKDYTDVVEQLKGAQKPLMEERQAVYRKGTLGEERSELDPIIRDISDEFASFQQERGAKRMNDVLDKEVQWLNSQSPDDLSRPEFLQQRKEYLNSLAEPYYKALERGGDPERINPLVKGYAALAKGYMKKLEGLSEKVRPLNEKWAGLDIQANRAAELAAIERGATPSGAAEDLIQSIRPSPENAIATFIRRILRKDVKGLTKGIEKASSRANFRKGISDILDSLNPEKELPDRVNLDFSSEQKLLEGPQPRQLESRAAMASRNRPSDIKKGRLITGSKEGKTIYSEGRAPTIELPEYLESDLQSLSKKYGVPERNLRSSETMPEISGSSPISKESWRNLSPKERFSIRELLKRRHRNFPNA